jgi:hypothetical protein
MPIRPDAHSIDTHASRASFAKSEGYREDDIKK